MKNSGDRYAEERSGKEGVYPCGKGVPRSLSPGT